MIQESILKLSSRLVYALRQRPEKGNCDSVCPFPICWRCWIVQSRAVTISVLKAATESCITFALQSGEQKLIFKNLRVMVRSISHLLNKATLTPSFPAYILA